jgi:hypothetical protein
MLGEEAFEAAVEDAKRLEKKMTEYSPYKGDVNLEATMDLEPEDYEDLDYLDLQNLYERSQKILSAKEMGIYAEAPKKEKVMKPSADTEEVESRLREMTTETLKTAEEVRKEPVAAPKAPVKEEPSIIDMIEIEKPPEIELEKPPKKEEIEIEKPPVPEIEIEKPPPEKIEIEKPEAPKVEVPAKPPAVPPALRESPDEAASRRYQKMEEQIRTMLGEKADTLTLKKKMLDLTKQLFKEKSVNKREEIKLQITVLKNMLVSAKAGVKRKGEKKDETHAKLYDTILSTQQAEIARTKDEIINKYNKRVGAIKKKFYEDVASAEEPAKRKQIYEGFVFSVTSLVEQLPSALEEYRDFTMKKHMAEMEKLGESLSEKDKDVGKKVEKRLGYIKDSYDTEFSAVRGIIGREIDNLIEVTGGEVFEEAKEMPEAEETKAHEIVKEIDDTDEGTLLYHLHSKDADYYKKYERKQISKAEAIFRAKALMAKEKGLSQSMVKKYFSQTED